MLYLKLAKKYAWPVQPCLLLTMIPTDLFIANITLLVQQNPFWSSVPSPFQTRPYILVNFCRYLSRTSMKNWVLGRVQSLFPPSMPSLELWRFLVPRVEPSMQQLMMWNPLLLMVNWRRHLKKLLMSSIFIIKRLLKDLWMTVLSSLNDLQLLALYAIVSILMVTTNVKQLHCHLAVILFLSWRQPILFQSCLWQCW